MAVGVGKGVGEGVGVGAGVGVAKSPWSLVVSAWEEKSREVSDKEGNFRVAGEVVLSCFLVRKSRGRHLPTPTWVGGLGGGVGTLSACASFFVSKTRCWCNTPHITMCNNW